MPKPRNRYFLGYGDIKGVTPSQFRRLGSKKQAMYIVNWFKQRYEDPAHETPYESAEGGYQYIWGGPFDAREEVDDEFSGIASEKAIEEAIEEIESDGVIEWAPTDFHPSRIDEMRDWEEIDAEVDLQASLAEISQNISRGGDPRYGSAEETAARAKVLGTVDSFLHSFTRPEARGGIGHNNPPPEYALELERSLNNIAADISAIKMQLNRENPDAGSVTKSASDLLNAKNETKGIWGIFKESAAKSAGDDFGKWVSRMFLFAAGWAGLSMIETVEKMSTALDRAIDNVLLDLVHWLNTVVLPLF